MKAWQAARVGNDKVALAPLHFPSLHRDGGWVDPMPYRQQASGELPMPKQNLSPSSGLRTISLSAGAHRDLFASGGDTLNFIISGSLRLAVSDGETTLEPGDLLLVRGEGADALSVETPGGCRLVQLGVGPDWPGPDAAQQDEGSTAPRRRTEPNLRRMDKQVDGRTWFSAFDSVFPAEDDSWSHVTPILGFRFLRFPDAAFIDWHPEVVNNLAIFLSGDMEIEIGGGANDGGPAPVDHFVAGDILLAADRTGEGHIDRMHGVIHLALIVIEDQHLWPIIN
ncbi:MAG: hypothetical protein V4579_09765 [Pseudomonadota bacterium]